MQKNLHDVMDGTMTPGLLIVSIQSDEAENEYKNYKYHNN